MQCIQRSLHTISANRTTSIPQASALSSERMYLSWNGTPGLESNITAIPPTALLTSMMTTDVSSSSIAKITRNVIALAPERSFRLENLTGG